jgi:hypothetical protein
MIVALTTEVKISFYTMFGWEVASCFLRERSLEPRGRILGCGAVMSYFVSDAGCSLNAQHFIEEA